MWIKPRRPLPFKYNLRSLLVRKGSSALTLASISLTVMVFAVMAGLASGLAKTYSSTGRENVMIALSKGADTAEISRLNESSIFLLKYNAAVRHRVDGTPMFSPEVYAIKPLLPPNKSINDVDRKKDVTARWLPIRGLRLENMDLYPDVKITEGRALEGPQEVMVGRLVSTKLGRIKLGDMIELGRQKHRVVGFFASQGTAYESELWISNDDLLLDFNIPTQSIAVFPLATGVSVEEVKASIEHDPRLQVELKTEKEYFLAMAESYGFVRIIGNVIAIIMSIGALFAGMNTMYASVTSRIREIGTLRALGFSRTSIQLSFVFESLILAGFSGVLGILAALLFNGVSLSFMKSSFHIQIGVPIVLQGMFLAVMVGFIGGYFPARSAAKMKIVDVMNG